MKPWMHRCRKKSLGITLKHLLLCVFVIGERTVLDRWNITLHCSCLDFLLPLQLSLRQAQIFGWAADFFFFVTNNKVFYNSQICRALVSLAAVPQPNSMSTEEMLLEVCTVYTLLVLQHTHIFPLCTRHFVAFPPAFWAKDSIDVTAPPILEAHRFDYRR